MSTRRHRYSCAWCGRDIVDSSVGRRRKYCRQSCRQRAYEQRSLTAGTSIANDAVILSAVEAEALLDRLFSLRCAAEDLATAIDEQAGHDELSQLCAALVEQARAAERVR